MSPTKSDEELMERFQNGDNSAFDILFARYQQPMLGYLDRFLGNPDTAEDIFQQTFLRLWEKRSSYKRQTLFKTYLYTIASNLARDTLRHQAVQKEVEVDMKLIPAKPVPLEQDERLEALKEAVEKLPPDQRECFVLARYQELSYQEIARVLGISLSAVKMRIHRAHKTITEALAGQL